MDFILMRTLLLAIFNNIKGGWAVGIPFSWKRRPIQSNKANPNSISLLWLLQNGSVCAQFAPFLAIINGPKCPSQLHNFPTLVPPLHSFSSINSLPPFYGQLCLFSLKYPPGKSFFIPCHFAKRRFLGFRRMSKTRIVKKIGRLFVRPIFIWPIPFLSLRRTFPSFCWPFFLSANPTAPSWIYWTQF